MALTIAVLPLRVPANEYDLGAHLSSHLDGGGKSQSMSVAECMDDVERISALRTTITQAINQRDGYEDALQVRGVLQEYFGVLSEFELRGIGTGKYQSTSPLNLEWNSAISSTTEGHSTLTWERAGVLWNLIALETYQGSQRDYSSETGWGGAAQHFSKAATLLKYLTEIVVVIPEGENMSSAVSLFPSLDFFAPFLRAWQSVCVALSQRCYYESSARAPRPRNLLLAKLAAASVPLFHSCEKLSQKVASSSSGISQDDTFMMKLSSDWSDYSRAWGMCLSAQSEYHQACLHRDREEWGVELARLDLAHRYSALCYEYCKSAPLEALQPLNEYVDGELLPMMEDRLEEAEIQNTKHNQEIPKRSDLSEIRGQHLIDLDDPLEALIPPLSTPCFSNVLSPHVQRYATLFQMEMNKMVVQMASIAEEKSESARRILAEVHLPYSLITYQKEMHASGVIPDDLWQRVELIQSEQILEAIRQDLWNLQDVAESTRGIFSRVQSQLDFDLESDQLFRQQNPKYGGHSAEEVQKSFKQTQSNYEKLLNAAQQGDNALMRRYEAFEADPKYKLIQCHKSELGQVLPVAMNIIDTTYLGRALVELSALFHDRDVLLNTFKQEVECFDIRTPLTDIDSRSPTADQEYRDALTTAQKSFDSLVYEVQTNLNKQVDLLESILQENQMFMRIRNEQMTKGTANSGAKLIESALEEVGHISKHLAGGKSFYEMLIPKMEKFRQQASEVSDRLAADRLKYDDKSKRSQVSQETMISQESSNPSNGNYASVSSQDDSTLHSENSFSNNPAGNAHDQNQGCDNQDGGMQPGYDQHNPDQSGRDGYGGGAARRHFDDRGSPNDNYSSGTPGNYGDRGTSGNNYGGNFASNNNYGGDGSGGGPSNDYGSGGGNGNRNYGSGLDRRSISSGGGSGGSGGSYHESSYNHQQQQQQQQNQAYQQQRQPSYDPSASARSDYSQSSNSQSQGPCVDDEKVAALMAMEFDPAKIVDALRKHDNNMDMALNELLSG